MYGRELSPFQLGLLRQICRCRFRKCRCRTVEKSREQKCLKKSNFVNNCWVTFVLFFLDNDGHDHGNVEIRINC